MENVAASAETPVINALERRLDLSIDVAEFDKDVEQRLRQIGRNMKMAGFRPGKVPAHIVRQQHGEHVRNEALGEVLERLFSEAVTARQLRVAGPPTIEAKEAATPGQIVFSAAFEVYPEITLQELTGVTIERPQLQVGAAEIEATIDILRKQRMWYEAVDRPAAEGDRITLDFLGKKDGEPFAGGEGRDYRFVLGEGRMLPDFEKEIRGARLGETKSFTLTFPADYFMQELAAQTASFEITVKEVAAPIVPEVDAEFAKLLGVQDGDVAKMRAEVEANLRREVRRRLQARLVGQVMDALLRTNPIAVPQTLVQRETERLLQVARHDMEQRGMKESQLPMQPEWFAEQARRRVSLGLIIAELVKRHELQAQPDQVKTLVIDAAQSYEHPDEVVRWHYAQPERLAEFQGAAVEANVVDWMLARVPVVDKAVAFSELMGHGG